MKGEHASMNEARSQAPEMFVRGAWAMAFALLLIVYPASLGPAARLHDSGLLHEPARAGIRLFYWPIFLMAKSNRDIERTLKWYLAEWNP